MFYSHEVLTSRKYGVATVWLVATLGSKSTLRKVNRKAILGVDVPKACATVLTPEAPMALRLQSNLLYGLSRVYSEQVSYILTDAQQAQNNIRAMLRIVKTAELDTEAGRARPEQLLLEDDPSFLPDFALAPLDFDLSNLDVDPSQNLPSIGSSQHSRRSTSLEEQYGGPVGGFNLPSSDSPGVGGSGSFGVQGDEGRGSALDIHREEDFMPEADFAFDAEGNLLELAPAEQPHPATPRMDMRPGLPRSSAAADRVRREHEEAAGAGGEIGADMDVDAPLGDEFDLLPEEPAFPSAHDRSSSPSGRLISDEAAEASSLVVPQRRQRKMKVIPLDETPEIRNTELADWINNYPANMNQAAQHKQNLQVNAQAKRNAEFWVVNSGLGGLGARAELPGPLDMFHGDSLLRSLGIERNPAGQKRAAGESAEEATTDEEGRRVRQRMDEQEAPRGQDAMDEDGFVNIDDIDVELPRDAAEEADDHLSTAMPWNVTASVRGSSAQPVFGLGSIGPGGATSAGGPSSIGRRGSRMVSASPLLGRGRPGGLDSLHSLTSDGIGGDDTLGGLGGEDIDMGGGDDEFEMYGPAAAVDTQTAGESQWVRGALARESDNFFLFIQDELEKKRMAEDDGHDANAVNEVLFEEMLLPRANTHIVAAQGLLHVLTLATAGAIAARQDEPFGSIAMRVVRADG